MNRPSITVWRVKSALWNLYETSTAFVDIPIDLENDGEEVIAALYRRIRVLTHYERSGAEQRGV